MSAAEPFYYICDECGDIADISEQPHADGVQWVCEHADEEEHGDSTLSVFQDKDTAVSYSTRTMNKHHAAKMARLDQAIARADEMRGTS